MFRSLLGLTTSTGDFGCPVTLDEFKIFHGVERALYSILVKDLWRNPSESLQVMGLWLWLERGGSFSNVLNKIIFLPVFFINELADEALTCLNCIKNQLPLADSLEIPLTNNLVENNLFLLLLQENAYVEVTKLINEVCIPALSDIRQRARRGGFGSFGGSSTHNQIPIQASDSSSTYQVGQSSSSPDFSLFHSFGGSSTHNQIPIQPSASSSTYQVGQSSSSPGFSLFHSFGGSSTHNQIPIQASASSSTYQVGQSSSSPDFSLFHSFGGSSTHNQIPIHASASSSTYQVGQSSSSPDFSLFHSFGGSSTHNQIPIQASANSSTYEVGQSSSSPDFSLFRNFSSLNLRGDASNSRVRPRTYDVSRHERTMFATFSKGYPVSENEVRTFFTRQLGNCIESVRMQAVGAGEQALYARIVFVRSNVIDSILKGQSKAKFTINGKHVWVRKFVPRTGSLLPCGCPSVGPSTCPHNE